MLGKGFGDVGEAKGSSTTGSQFLEQFKTAQALAQLAAQHTQPGGSTAASSWDMGSTTQTSSLVQYGKEKQLGSPERSAFAWRCEGFRGGPDHKFTTKAAVLEKLKELWVQVCEVERQCV